MKAYYKVCFELEDLLKKMVAVYEKTPSEELDKVCKQTLVQIALCYDIQKIEDSKLQIEAWNEFSTDIEEFKDLIKEYTDGL